MFQKIKINSTPSVQHLYEVSVDLVNHTFSYKDKIKDQLFYQKIDEENFKQIDDLIDEIFKLRKNNYSGPIKMNGFYWEFDLITHSNKMIEIEGINVIDDTVIQILSDFENILKINLGVEELKGFIHD